MTTLIESHEVNNLAELRLTLDRMSLNALHQIDDSYVLISQAPIRVELVCETLTDGSEVYNLAVKL